MVSEGNHRGKCRYGMEFNLSDMEWKYAVEKRSTVIGAGVEPRGL